MSEELKNNNTTFNALPIVNLKIGKEEEQSYKTMNDVLKELDILICSLNTTNEWVNGLQYGLKFSCMLIRELQKEKEADE